MERKDEVNEREDKKLSSLFSSLSTSLYFEIPYYVLKGFSLACEVLS